MERQGRKQGETHGEGAQYELQTTAENPTSSSPPHTEQPSTPSPSYEIASGYPDSTSNSPPPPTPSSYTYLETLRRDYENGIPSAIAYMQGLRDYTEECQHEQEEWSADRRAEIRQNHNITYPKRDYLAEPRSWGALDDPGHGLPTIIEGSRPLRPALKRRRYRNSRATNSRATFYRTAQPRPPPEPEEGDVAPATPPHPITLRIGHHNNKGADRRTHYINSDTTPYSTSRSRPPPWPNKYRNRNQYQHNSKYTPARNTMGRRPPPWPIIPTPTPILSITNPRPPPWPIISYQTIRNRRNAKRRLKAKSRRTSDKVSI
jgi:hypothetical protein